MGLPVHLCGRGGPPAGLPCGSQIPSYSSLSVRSLRDLDHHVTACSEGAKACWGGGVLGLLSVRPHFCWGGVGAAKGLLPCFLVPKGNQPTACTLALWWLKFGPTGGEGRGGDGGGVSRLMQMPVPRYLPLQTTIGAELVRNWPLCLPNKPAPCPNAALDRLQSQSLGLVLGEGPFVSPRTMCSQMAPGHRLRGVCSRSCSIRTTCGSKSGAAPAFVYADSLN